MKKQVFYIHGGDVFSSYDDFLRYLQNKDVDPEKVKPKKWSEGLKDKLGEEFQVICPEMPNKNNAKYEEWKIWFERYVPYMQDGAILIGASLGAGFLIKYLCENNLPIKPRALFLVAGPVIETNEVLNEAGEDGGDFIFDASRLPTLSKKAEEIIIFHSKDDPVVPYEHAFKLKKALPGAELVTFEDKNHFLIEEFPELVERIKNLG